MIAISGRDPKKSHSGHSFIEMGQYGLAKKRQVTSQIGGRNGNTQLLLEIHKTSQVAWRRYKLAQAATKEMIMHTFKDYHFSELQDDNEDVARYTAFDLFYHLMDQYVQLEHVADQIPTLHKILEQNYAPGVLLQNSTRCKEHS